jgi:hypothetical protein
VSETGFSRFEDVQDLEKNQANQLIKQIKVQTIMI